MSRFLTYLDALKYASDETISIDLIFNALKDVIPLLDKALRPLFIDSLQSLHIAKDYDTIDIVAARFNSLRNNQIPDMIIKKPKLETESQLVLAAIPETRLSRQENVQGCFVNLVFNIQNLNCEIFQFLDFKSLINCRKVNNQWLYDSYHPSSIYHINTSDIK